MDRLAHSHWDRVGKKDDHSSCWIRVLHAWSGAGWGAQFTPRIGMEVLVIYHQGDPDKPVVIGCLPNAVTPQPFMLPEDATRSGLRTNTLPSNGGYNELSFEDALGSEQIYLRAERNYDEVVQHDHTVDVGCDEHESVGGSRHENVDGSHVVVVGGNETATVGGSRNESVGGQRDLRVAGNASDTVDGLEERSIGESAYLTTRGNYQMTVSGSWDTAVGSHDNPSSAHTAVWGESVLLASDEIRLQSETRIVLRCGESCVTLTPTEVRISGKAVVVDGHESTTIFGKKPVMHLTDTMSLASDAITLTAKGASLELTSNATLLGSQVKLAKGGSAKTEGRKLDPAESKPFQVRLCDPEHKPYADREYDITAGGQRFHGTTDGDGNLIEQVPKSATMADLTLWLEPAPTGKHVRWQVHIEEELPPASDPVGAQIRLRNLGYFTGDIGEQASDALRQAIQAFQLAHPELPKDGELVAATVDWLTKDHGH